MSQLRTNSIVPVGGIPAGASGGGVVQIVEGSTITQVESSFSSETNLGLSASITPRSSSNKILIMVNMTGCGSRDTATAWRNALKRDSTDLASFNNYTGSQQASGGRNLSKWNVFRFSSNNIINYLFSSRKKIVLGQQIVTSAITIQQIQDKEQL
jgi:hypothetical protein